LDFAVAFLLRLASWMLPGSVLAVTFSVFLVTVLSTQFLQVSGKASQNSNAFSGMPFQLQDVFWCLILHMLRMPSLWKSNTIDRCSFV
jgi:hypothetical protein